MPPKTVRCCICGQDVLKSQTYATGEKDDDGNSLRACKEHEGIVEKAEELKKQAQEELKKTMSESPFPGAKLYGIPLGSKHAKYAQKASPEQREKDRQMLEEVQSKLGETERFAEWAWTHCWCCERPGLHLKEFFELQMIAWEKAKMMGIANPISDEMRKVIAGVVKQVGAKCVLHRFEMDEEMYKKYQEWRLRIHHKCRGFPEMVKTIQLCFDCQKRTGIQYDLQENLPKIDLETALVMGASYEGSETQKANKVLAAGSIVRDQEAAVRRAESN